MAAAKEKVKHPNLTTPPFVAGFPSFFEKTQYKDGKPNYNTVALFDPKSYKGKEKERWDALMAEVDTECMRVFGKSWKDCKKPYNDEDPDAGGIKDFKAGLYLGKAKAKAGKAGYKEDTVWSRIKTYNPPGVVQFNGVGKVSTVISEEEGNTDLVYSGVVGRSKVAVVAYNTDGSAGVSLWLNSFQKLKDGTRLDTRGDATKDYDEDEPDAEWLDAEEPAADDPFA